MLFGKVGDRHIEDRCDVIIIKRIIDGLALAPGLDELLGAQGLKGVRDRRLRQAQDIGEIADTKLVVI